MATIRILLGIICLIATGWNSLPGSSFIENHKLVGSWKSIVDRPMIGLHKNPPRYSVKNAVTLVVENNQKSSKVLAVAQSQLGVREATGKNDGLEVEAYLTSVGEQKGAPWCAAFVSWVFGRAGYGQPKTAWSPALFPLQKRSTAIQPATVFGIYFPALERIAHCGFVERREGHWIITIEGNTNLAGSREGDGVYRKRRLVRTIRAFADWTRGKEVRKHEKI